MSTTPTGALSARLSHSLRYNLHLQANSRCQTRDSRFWVKPLTLDVHQRAQLNFARIMVLPMHARRAEDKIQQRGVVDPLYFLFCPVVTHRRCRHRGRRGGGCMRRKRSRQESETRRCDDAQHDGGEVNEDKGRSVHRTLRADLRHFVEGYRWTR